MIKLLLIILFSVVSTASALELHGSEEQGGVLLGKTVPGATVSLGDNQTTAGDDGTFVMGIPRLQPEKSTLSINLMGGIEEKYPLVIKQRDYKTQYIKGVAKKTVNPSDEDMKQINADTAQILSARAVEDALPYVWQQFEFPVKDTPITGVYGSRRFYNGEERNWHKGVDFAAPTGTPVHAPADGIVRLALPNSFFNGNLVIVDHGYQLMTIYAHLNDMSVKVGDKVSQGDILGHIGTTGRSTGPHLHWGLYWRNMALDPMLLVKKEK